MLAILAQMVPQAQQASGQQEFVSGFVWVLAFVAYIAGTVQYFRGNHIGLGWVSVFIPFVFIGGFFTKPKPGSSRYMNYDPVKKAEADLRWPMHAKAYHDLMGDKDPKMVHLATPVTPVTAITQITETPESEL